MTAALDCDAMCPILLRPRAGSERLTGGRRRRPKARCHRACANNRVHLQRPGPPGILLARDGVEEASTNELADATPPQIVQVTDNSSVVVFGRLLHALSCTWAIGPVKHGLHRPTFSYALVRTAPRSGA